MHYDYRYYIVCTERLLRKLIMLACVSTRSVLCNQSYQMNFCMSVSRSEGCIGDASRDRRTPSQSHTMEDWENGIKRMIQNEQERGTVTSQKEQGTVTSYKDHAERR